MQNWLIIRGNLEAKLQFIYFIPSSNGLGQAGLIKKAGLDNILDDPQKVTSNQIFSGPDGLAGFLFSFCQPKELKYKPAPAVSSEAEKTNCQGFDKSQQVWQKSNCGKYYIGFYSDSPPTEKELARDVQITGHPVKLGHGQTQTETQTDTDKWIIPLARIFPAGTKLPQSLILGSNGEVVTETLPKFVRFSAMCEKLWREFEIQIGLAAGEKSMTTAEGFTLATEALAINYRINVDGINILKLFNTQNIAQILLAVIDAQTVQAKMTELVGSSQDEKKS